MSSVVHMLPFMMYWVNLMKYQESEQSKHIQKFKWHKKWWRGIRENKTECHHPKQMKASNWSSSKLEEQHPLKLNHHMSHKSPTNDDISFQKHHFDERYEPREVKSHEETMGLCIRGMWGLHRWWWKMEVRQINAGAEVNCC